LKTLVIGDIHGCYTEMLDLISLAGLSGEDQIIALGDIVDRGPDSLAVANFFMNKDNAASILGNHEAKHILISANKLKPSPSQEIVHQEMSGKDYITMIEYFQQLQPYLELPEALIIHGFLEPGIELKNQQKKVLIGTISGEGYLTKTYPKPWYEYDHGDKPIIAGHHDYSGIGKPTVIRSKTYLLDTGCCFGRNLTGLLLPDFRLLSVKSRKNYWGLAMQGYNR
jgi:serine/threonine protein phosphatase 1